MHSRGRSLQHSFTIPADIFLSPKWFGGIPAYRLERAHASTHRTLPLSAQTHLTFYGSLVWASLSETSVLASHVASVGLQGSQHRFAG